MTTQRCQGCKRRSTEFQSTSNLTPTLLTHFLSVTRFDISENSTIFRSQPASDVDAMGKKRFVGEFRPPPTPTLTFICIGSHIHHFIPISLCLLYQCLRGCVLIAEH